MMSYVLNIDSFAGPLEKLLELIEKKKMEITRVSLAEITADFLEYVKKLENIEPRVLSDFIAVAARLILIKSKSLLPEMELTDKEEESIEELEQKIKIYKEIKSAGKLFYQLWLDDRRSFSRELLFGLKEGGFFYPPPSLELCVLNQNLERLNQVLSTNRFEEAEKKIISFEHYVNLLLKRVKAGSSKFSDLSRGKNKSETVGLFLALLYLLKDKLFEIRQEGRFSDILIISSDV